MQETIVILAVLLVIAVRLLWSQAGRIVELRKEVERQECRVAEWVAAASDLSAQRDRALAATKIDRRMP